MMARVFSPLLWLPALTFVWSIAACQPTPVPRAQPTAPVTIVTPSIFASTAMRSQDAFLDDTVPPPTYTATPRPTATPEPPTHTPTVQPTVRSPLLLALQPLISGAPTFEVSGERYSQDYYAALFPTVHVWLNKWLTNLLREDIDPAIRLSAFRVREYRRWLLMDYPEDGNENFSVSLDIQPLAGADSLWLEGFHARVPDGWIHHDGLMLTFHSTDGVFRLTEIHLHRPFDFAYDVPAAEFEGASREDILTRLMTRWFSGFTTGDVHPDYHVRDYAIDDMDVELIDDTGANALVTFSINFPMPLSDRIGAEWFFGVNPFSGHYADTYYDWVVGMLRYVGIRQQGDTIRFEALDGKAAPFNTLWDGLAMTLPVDASLIPPGASEEAIGRVLVDQYLLTWYATPARTTCLKIIDYTIDSVSVEVEGDYWDVDTLFSVLPHQIGCGLDNVASPPSWAPQGRWDESTGWVHQISQQVSARRVDGGFVIWYVTSEYAKTWSTGWVTPTAITTPTP